MKRYMRYFASDTIVVADNTSHDDVMLMALSKWNPSVTGGFPTQRPRNAALNFSLMLA